MINVFVFPGTNRPYIDLKKRKHDLRGWVRQGGVIGGYINGKDDFTDVRGAN